VKQRDRSCTSGQSQSSRPGEDSCVGVGVRSRWQRRSISLLLTHTLTPKSRQIRQTESPGRKCCAHLDAPACSKPQSTSLSLSKSGLDPGPDIDFDEGMQSIRNDGPCFKAKQNHLKHSNAVEFYRTSTPRSRARILVKCYRHLSFPITVRSKERKARKAQ